MVLMDHKVPQAFKDHQVFKEQAELQLLKVHKVQQDQLVVVQRLKFKQPMSLMV